MAAWICTSVLYRMSSVGTVRATGERLTIVEAIERVIAAQTKHLLEYTGYGDDSVLCDARHDRCKVDPFGS
jgi:hypothetical protein